MGCQPPRPEVTAPSSSCKCRWRCLDVSSFILTSPVFLSFSFGLARGLSILLTFPRSRLSVASLFPGWPFASHVSARCCVRTKWIPPEQPLARTRSASRRLQQPAAGQRPTAAAGTDVSLPPPAFPRRRFLLLPACACAGQHRQRSLGQTPIGHRSRGDASPLRVRSGPGWRGGEDCLGSGSAEHSPLLRCEGRRTRAHARWTHPCSRHGRRRATLLPLTAGPPPWG